MTISNNFSNFAVNGKFTNGTDTVSDTSLTKCIQSLYKGHYVYSHRIKSHFRICFKFLRINEFPEMGINCLEDYIAFLEKEEDYLNLSE